ncbi:MAG: glycerophosphodiester phosphodiesterase family protein, partial [Hyphomonas sp.]
MMRRFTPALIGIALALTACTQDDAADAAGKAPAGALIPAPASDMAAGANLAPLPELFDCLRETGGVVVAAHRGGPAPGYPENLLETMQYGFDRGIRLFEIDIHESRDGVLFLHHDSRFGRVIDGQGSVADTDWADIAGRRTKDNDGKLTAFNPSKLTDVLLWA